MLAQSLKQITANSIYYGFLKDSRVYQSNLYQYFTLFFHAQHLTNLITVTPNTH